MVNAIRVHDMCAQYREALHGAFTLIERVEQKAHRTINVIALR